MRVKCSLMLEYASSDDALKIKKALEPDNEDFISTRVDGNVLEATSEADSISSLLHTLDDFLACLSVAERTMEVLK